MLRKERGDLSLQTMQQAFDYRQQTMYPRMLIDGQAAGQLPPPINLEPYVGGASHGLSACQMKRVSSLVFAGKAEFFCPASIAV